MAETRSGSGRSLEPGPAQPDARWRLPTKGASAMDVNGPSDNGGKAEPNRLILELARAIARMMAREDHALEEAGRSDDREARRS